MNSRPYAGDGHQLPLALDSDRPKGVALRVVLDRLIEALGPGTMLPSERTLAERYGLARTTVRQVLDGMVLEGRAYRLQGSGTFVRGDRANLPPGSLPSFAEDMYSRGLQPGSLVLSRAPITASELISSHLEVALGAAALQIESLLSADGEPMAIQRRYLPLGDASDVPANGRSGQADHEPPTPHVHADQWVSAVRLAAEEARLLEVTSTQPGLLVQRVLRDARRVVVEYSRAVYRGDRYELHSSLRKG